MQFKEMTSLRRFIAMAIVLLIVSAMLAGCGRIVENAPKSISIYATFYPVYALTDAVMRDVPDAELHCLAQPQDGCLRSYQLSDWDVALLASGADAVIAGGRGLESFESALFEWGDNGPAISALLYNLELYNQNGSSAVSGEEESHLAGPNPHLYMSIAGAKQMTESIYAMMLSLDPKYADLYVENAGKASEQLDALLAEMQAMLNPFGGERVILMNEALIYTAQDFDFEVADWIDRESGVGMYGEELSACIERLSVCEAKVVLIERQAPSALVEALESAGYAVARIDVMSTHREGEGFETYLEIQRSNASAIHEAFMRADSLEDIN